MQPTSTALFAATWTHIRVPVPWWAFALAIVAIAITARYLNRRLPR